MGTKRSVMSTNEKETLRLKGLLHVALHCLHLDDTDDIVITLGSAMLNYKKYMKVLSPEDVYGKWVYAWMTQARVEVMPEDRGMKHFLEHEHSAAFVRVNWLYAHMLLKSDGDFDEAVKFAERAAETLCRVSFKIGDAALTLAQALGIQEHILEVDEAALKAIVPEHPLHVSVPRLPYDFFRWMGDPTTVVPLEAKSEARVTFETEIMEVFSYWLCIGDPDYVKGHEVQISSTGLRKYYTQMTSEERYTSGTVMLGHLIQHLEEDNIEQAILGSLVAARALEGIARKLLRAVELYCAS